MDEVFGSENFVAHDHVQEDSGSFGETCFPATCDYILWYAEDREAAKYRQLYLREGRGARSRRRTAASSCLTARDGA